jgi:hypothetical protein
MADDSALPRLRPALLTRGRIVLLLAGNTEWTKVSGRGTPLTYVINHRPALDSEALTSSPWSSWLRPAPMTNIVEIEPC